MFSSNQQIHRLLLLLASLVFAGHVQALPEGEVVNDGSASFDRNGNQMTITQQTDRVSVNFQSFDIAPNERVSFIQPGVDSIALNRVDSVNPSQIMGALDSNGQIFLINPNGMVFGRDALVDVGGLVASTLNITDEDFFSSNFKFSANTRSDIKNYGEIKSDHGYVVFISQQVENSGSISAINGSIELHAADEILINIQNQSVAIESTRATLQGLVENHGLLSAQDGAIIIDSNSLDSLHTTVVNNTGIVEAKSLVSHNGVVTIRGDNGDVFNDGEINVDSNADSVSAGSVVISGNRIAQRGAINARGFSAADSAGGTISLHASDELFATSGSTANADAGNLGDGGEVIYFSDHNALFDDGAIITARGGALSGDGGFVEVSGLEWVSAEGFVDTRAVNGRDGTFLIDPTDIEIVTGNTNTLGDGFTVDNWIPVGPNSQIGTDNITTHLVTNNVVIDSNTGAGGTGDINVNAAIDLNGGNGRTLILQAFNDLNINANICEGGGACNFVDDSVNIFMSSGGKTSIADGVVVDAGNGTIAINSTGDATVTGLVSRSTNATAISIISGAEIFQSGNTKADFNVANGGLRLRATFGIANTGGSLDGIASQLDLGLAASGDINISTSSGDVELVNLTTPALMDTYIDVNGGGALTVSGFTLSDAIQLDADGDITINDTVRLDARGETIALTSTAGDINVTGLVTTSTSATAVVLNAAGSVNNGGNSNLDIDANLGRTVINSATGINNLLIDTESLNINNSTSGSVMLNELDNVTILGLVNGGATTQLTSNTGNIVIDNSAVVTADNLELNAATGSITLADSGLSVSGDLILKAQDINDQSGRVLDVSAADFTYIATAATGNIQLTTNVDRLDISHSAGNINILESNDLALLDIDGDSDAAVVGDGNLIIALASGDLTVIDNVTVTDNNANGVRAGLIDFQVNNGGISVGTTGATNIQSINTVDENATGGLGGEPSNQVAIRFLQNSSADSSHDFVFGDGVGSDVSITAQGGDIFVDAVGGASLSAGNARQAILNSDVMFTARDTGGGSNGVITLESVSNSSGAGLLADNARAILLRGAMAAAEVPEVPEVPEVLPPEVPEVLPPEVDIPTAVIALVNVTDSIAAVLQNSTSGTSVNSMNESPAALSNSESVFAQIFTGCNQTDAESGQSRKCAVDGVVRKFLKSFLIGDDLASSGE